MKEYRLTTLSCFVGIFTQAIITNITAVLFIPLMSLYGFDFVHLGILAGINFAAQVTADISFSGLIDKIGFRRITLPTCALAFAGLTLFALTPNLFRGHEYAGFVLSTVIFAFSSGLLEIILSPIIDGIPNAHKGPAMTLMHSFYAWGQVLTIVVTTLFLFVAGARHWQAIVFFWALVPLGCFWMFWRAKMPPNAPAHAKATGTKLFKNPVFWLVIGAILFGGATEVSINQWASTFLTGSLNIPKVTSDLLGMCGFAAMLGLGRTLYGTLGHKVNLGRAMVLGSALCVACYVLAALSPINGLSILACALAGFFASILWPGVIVTGAERFPHGGAWVFAILAAGGDIGAGAGPFFVGLITQATQKLPIGQWFTRLYNTTPHGAAMRLGILLAVIFPLGAMACNMLILRSKAKR